MRVLVTGAAGFIGAFVCKALLQRGDEVIACDNLNDYYDPELKRARLSWLNGQPGFSFHTCDIRDGDAVRALFAPGIDRVCHLAAQAGVRYSLKNPRTYVESNLSGFFSILDAAREAEVDHFVFASTSSVYGANTRVPFSTADNVDHPLSFYAATKKSNELMAHTYAHLYGLPVTGLRFFTVYGPWGRPDMALFRFTEKMLKGDSIPVYGYGEQSRDFTYIEDVVKGVIATLDQAAQPCATWDGHSPDPATSTAPYRIYNIGNQTPVKLMDFIATLERALGIQAKVDLQPMVPGDVPHTWADSSALQDAVGYCPDTPLQHGIAEFVSWYRQYYQC
jgi:UDP-glucuronate 4-epimerase